MTGRPTVACVGLTTLDVVYAVEHVPGPDEKVTAQRCTVAAGGPAANAAVTAAALGAAVTLVTAVGRHPLAAGVRADLAQWGVDVVDATPDEPAPPPLSTALITTGSGERAVVSRNATDRRVAAPSGLARVLAGAVALLVDGHHPELALAALRCARATGAVTLLDAGSWKERLEDLLPLVDVAVASAAFSPPGGAAPRVLADLLDRGVARAAVTDGPRPVRWRSRTGGGSVPVPEVAAVDTLGAGDVFHGAVLHALGSAGELGDAGFVRALEAAAAVAARSCTSFGTRDWLSGRP